MNSDCSVSSLSLKVRCDTRHLCRCTVLLKAVHSFVSDVFTSFDESMGGPDGSGEKSISAAYIRNSVDVMLVRLIIHT